MTELDSLLVLNAVNGLGNARIKKLIETAGSAAKLFSLTDGELKSLAASLNISWQVLENILHFPKDIYLKNEYNLIRACSVKLISWWDEAYPCSLKEIPDAPVLLYVRGDLKSLAEPAVAIVGSRRASIYGLSIAEKFAIDLSGLGLTVVSGLARGIDAAGHRGALKVGGKTIAVLGCGLSKIYPPEHKLLADAIAANGAVISEFHMTMPPLPTNFPRRNRIVSGLSFGVIVVEASAKSGALITADYALEQGREVFAVPGKIDQPNAWGVNRLIKEGAKLAGCLDDILEEIKGPLRRRYIEEGSSNPSLKSSRLIGLPLTKEECEVMERLDGKPVSIDELASQFPWPTAVTLSILSTLELKKQAKQLPGKMFVKFDES